MTYGMFKNVVKGLMLGDNNPPTDPNVYIGLLTYAFNLVGHKAESFHLLTLDRQKDLLRMASGDYFMRKPELPDTDESELDIDEELCFVVARFFCSLISAKPNEHIIAAEELLRNYNEKVYQILEDIKYDFRTKRARLSGGRNFDDPAQIPLPAGIIE